MNKLKSFLNKTSDKIHKPVKNEQLEPVVGFKLTLVSGEAPSASNNGQSSANTPELHVQLLGARHLPSSFGLKSVEGYMIKIKLFPGSTRFDSSVQTSSWPKFNETFKFPLASSHKSAFKTKKKETSDQQTLPEKCFEGKFVVLTVFALLEIPAGSVSAIKEKYIALKRKSSFLLNDVAGGQQQKNEKKEKDKEKEKVPNDKRPPNPLTISETQRNIGSVTWFLDPKHFEENFKNKTFITEEMWLPIRDITKKQIDPTKISVNSSAKGQIELYLELYSTHGDENNSTTLSDDGKDAKQSISAGAAQSTIDTQSSFNFSNMKRLLKYGSVSGSKKGKGGEGLFLKIAATKMRCSIKAKDEYENSSDEIYLKVKVFEGDILSESWKSEFFAPTLCQRWEGSMIVLPLPDEMGLQRLTVEVTIAAKSMSGRKIVLGSLTTGPGNTNPATAEHWQNVIANRGTPHIMWHNLE